MSMIVLQTIVLFGIFILTIITCALAIWHISGKKKLYTSGTNSKVKELLEEEKELYRKINKELKEAGWLNRILLKRKLGPLYDWYTEGYIE